MRHALDHGHTQKPVRLTRVRRHETAASQSAILAGCGKASCRFAAHPADSIMFHPHGNFVFVIVFVNKDVTLEPMSHPETFCARSVALALLIEPDPAAKAHATQRFYERLPAGEALIDATQVIAEPPSLPGRPDKPVLVAPSSLKRRSMQSDAGRAVLLHALAHIEFNAINLALDAVWRFPSMPRDFYLDWFKVAAEEASHFLLLTGRLADFGHSYGDFPAHDGLWEMAERTRGDVLARMALVPRTLEARGLDAAPPIRRRLAQAGDHASAAILDVILRDEIGHVLIGNHWFRFLCDAAGVDPHPAYAQLAALYHAPKLRGPFNFEARRDAGFDEAELRALEGPEE
jgi:uncharacterized ferritin-like protein (DUF455 family)